MAKQAVFKAQQWAFSYVEATHRPGVDRTGVEFLLQKLMGWNQSQLLVNLRSDIPEDKLAIFYDWIKKYVAGYPPQYLVGEADFFGRSFKVNESVLIPRDDTATLVESVLAKFSPAETNQLRLLDLGCGSGILAITLELELGFKEVVASDISAAALAVTKQNAHLLNAKIMPVLGDLFTGVADQRFDLIVSNPPYIGEDELSEMDYSTKTYEPKLALFASDAGLAFYKRIAGQVEDVINPGGRLYMEIGYRQAESVVGLFSRLKSVSNVVVKQDLSGHPRCVVVTF